MQAKKYGVVGAVKICFRHAPGAALCKLALEVAGGALTPLMVLAVAFFIDSAVSYVNGGRNPTPLITAIALMAGCYAYSEASQIVIRLADKSLENALRGNVRPLLVQKQARTDFALLEDPDTSDLISRVCDNSEKNIAAILNTGIGIVKLFIQVSGTMAILAAYAWWFIPLFVASAVPIALIARKGGKAIYASDAVTTVLTRRHYYLSSILVGRETAAERALFGYTAEINRKFSAAHLKRSNMVTKEIAMEEAAVNACGLILNVLVIAAVFFLLPSVGSRAISHGLYVSLIGALIGLTRAITGGVSRLVSDATGFTAFMRDYTRFFALKETGAGEIHAGKNGDGGDTDSGGNGGDGGETVSAGNGRKIEFAGLEIRGLRFRYTAESPYVLDGVNIVIEKGKTYSLIGRNGAGKSTLAKILLGLYRNFEGEILINGVDISLYGAEELRRIFSIVYQDFAKYYIPFGDNIALGNERGDLGESLLLADLEGVAARLPQREKTPLGRIFDGGADVSGGEWQRIAIARALYADTPFMILDEPAASLSPMAESRLYRRFSEIIKDKTSLLISHRLGSTKLSDTLFVLEGGVVAETGTHDELMAADGVYAEMFKSQKSWYDERQ